MKKLSFLTSCLLAIVLSNPAGAQFQTVAATETLLSTTKHLAKSSVSEKLLKKFEANFPGVQGMWVETGTGYVVRFTKKGVENWAYLNKKGDCESTIRYYTESELPAEIRHRVKSMYYDHSITSVKEIDHHQSTAYLITVEDKTSWKVIRVVEDEMDVWEEHNKQ